MASLCPLACLHRRCGMCRVYRASTTDTGFDAWEAFGTPPVAFTAVAYLPSWWPDCVVRRGTYRRVPA